MILIDADYENEEEEEDENINKKHIKSKTINCWSGCDGGLITLSYHVVDKNSVKCYLFYLTQIKRFLNKDIFQHALPAICGYDVNLNNKRKQKNMMNPQQTELLTKIANKLYLPDCQFNFLKETIQQNSV